MGYDVERSAHRPVLAAEPEHKDYVPVLGDRGVGQELFQHVARQGDQTAHQYRGRPDNQHGPEQELAFLEQRIDSSYEQHPRRHHRRRVQISRDRSRRRHRARKPELKRDLGALGESGDRDETSGDIQEQARFGEPGKFRD